MKEKIKTMCAVLTAVCRITAIGTFTAFCIYHAFETSILLGTIITSFLLFLIFGFMCSFLEEEKDK